MAEFIALVVVIVATIYVFIKVKNSLQNKGKSKPTSIFLASVSSFLAFVVLVVLVSTFFQDSSKQTQTQKLKQEIETTFKVEDKVVKTPKEVVKDESKQIQKEDKKKPIESFASKNTYKVISSLENNYNIVPTQYDKSVVDTPVDESKMCYSDNSCQIYANRVQIQLTHKNVEARPTPKVEPQYYQNVCSAILLGLTDANKDLVEDIIFQAFDYASKNGSSQTEVMGVQITVEPKKNNYNLLSCEFYQY
ncbi:hypothetical protein AAHK07_02095 [Aliarcobacter cryaerophilus]|uniref:hypothetical protein n=1 Tax=Aliarcobacter cryaerophilus TaxID=28198 RepID=UPI0031759031